jgi:hypothetical protein
MTEERDESAREHERRAREHEPAERSPAGEAEAGEPTDERDETEAGGEGFRPPAAPPRGSPG